VQQPCSIDTNVCCRSSPPGYQSTRHTVISSHGHVVTRSTRHRSTRHTQVSSHSPLVTRQHIKPPVPVVIILCACLQETSRNTEGVIIAICVTLMYTADSQRQITLLQKAWSTRHNAVKHDGQLVTRFYGVKSWPCDELTGSRPPYGGRAIIMVALWNRADHYIFALWFLSSIFFLSSPNLSCCRLDVYHTSTHDVALVRI